MKIIKIAVSVLLVLVLLIVAGSYFFVKSTLPHRDGIVLVKGLDGVVEIMWDSWGVPHIFAETKDDLAFGMGYAMAQDRLWQMDMFRRVASGTLSEIIGEAALESDSFARVMGFRRNAHTYIDTMSTEEIAYVESFLLGINTYIEANPKKLPVEFKILGYEPEPFTVADVVALTFFQATASNGNYQFELSRYLAVSELGGERGRELMCALTFHGPYMSLPGYDDPKEGAPASAPWDTPILESASGPDPEVLAALVRANETFSLFTGLSCGTIHSNCWAVSGDLTESGGAMLANDYHMPLLLPSMWYEVHISGAGIDAMGITLPGFPAIVAGHNRDIAWGATTTGADTQDLYMERLNPENPDEYLYNGEYVPFDVVIETIDYKGKEGMESLELVVRISRHGPIINDVIPEIDETAPPLALREVAGASEGAFSFCMEIVAASNWEEFLGALEDFGTPVWNWVYADKNGNVGYKNNGRIPIRGKGSGLEPVPGWDADYEWIGIIPFEMLPEVYNPDTGYIVTANNEIVDDSFPYHIQVSSAATPFRSMRIEELVRGTEKHTPGTMRDIQADMISGIGPVVAGYVVEAVGNTPDVDERMEELSTLLASWDGDASIDSPAQALAHEVFVVLVEKMFKEKISEDLYGRFASRPEYVAQVLLVMLSDDSYAWWYDDVNTGDVEGRDGLLIAALMDADAALIDSFGTADVAEWAWGDIHTLGFTHALGVVPPFKWFWNVDPRPFGGDFSTVNPGNHLNIAEKPYAVTNGSSMRHIIDFGDFDSGSFVITTGESGRWLDPHYRDQAPLWFEVEAHPMLMERDDVEANAEAKLTLSPVR